LRARAMDRRNLRLQLWTEARTKDTVEVELSNAVRDGAVTLDEAQHEMATDWRAACREWIGPQGSPHFSGSRAIKESRWWETFPKRIEGWA
jgi:hypothetical protein